MVNFFLVIASLALQALATFLGVKLAVDPLETLQQRRTYKKAFIVILVIGVGITLAQEWRNSVEQTALRSELTKLRDTVDETAKGVQNIEDQTKQPPNITVTTPAPVVNVLPLAPTPPTETKAPRARVEIFNYELLPVTANRPVQVNVFARNTEPVGFEMRRYAAVGIIPAPLEMEQRQDFEDQLRKFVDDDQTKEQIGHQVAGTTSRAIWFTLDGPVLSEDAVERFKAGTLAVFFMGRIVYTDQRGKHTTTFCSFNQGNPKVFFQCTRFNTSD